jgi:protein gp37
MGEFTGIGWTLRTFNPWRGCKKISPGCANCYMFTEQYRYKLDPTIVTRTKTWGQPRKWQKALNGTTKKEMVFTCSWSDFFIEQADPWREEAWKLIKSCPNLIFQILTKRPKLIPKRLPADWGTGYDNVALGVSIESAAYNGRADDLRVVPARWRFISAEPLLASVKGLDLKDIHWLIAGGESGPGFRIMDLDWAREARDMCAEAKVPFFYKQDSGPVPGKNNILDNRTWEEWPAEWLNS